MSDVGSWARGGKERRWEAGLVRLEGRTKPDLVGRAQWGVARRGMGSGLGIGKGIRNGYRCEQTDRKLVREHWRQRPGRRAGKGRGKEMLNI